MKSIYTLIPDIEYMLEKEKNWINERVRNSIALGISGALAHSNSQRAEGFKPTLRLSQMGPRCPRALWHSIHTPTLAEPLPASAIIKYTYGHIIESLVIEMAKAAGHEVTGEQDVIILDGVQGHRDCVIDGCIVDVKSSSSRSFQKFKDGSIETSDAFGYLDQLDGYVLGSVDDDLVHVKDRGYLLAVDKQLGHLALHEHHTTRLRSETLRARIEEYKAIVGRSNPPECTCQTVKDGESGNFKLDVKASYSAFKHCCFPNLRTFLYSDGPRYLVKVVRQPKRRDGTLIPEVDKNGNIVYG